MSKNAIIIGGTSGIGLETAKYLRDNGYDVLVGGRTPLKNDTGIIYSQIDVTNESSIERFFSSLPFKQIDSIIYSAGITTGKKSIRNFDVNEYQKVHEVNLLGAILTLKYSYHLLKKAKGRVVIVNSFASRTYSQLSGFEYTVTKAGLSGLVKQLAIEWANDGVLINTIFPSMVETPMLLKKIEPSIIKSIESKIPLGRIAKPNDISPVIEFLISDKNNYITGSGIDINGGQFLSG
ncbi:SDR family oxidoreductase [Candidatus Pseudothioglobus singularis]|nr:SDR family oxidoreductase [Candidatus Pseudothioglobus singularis]